MQVGIGKCNIIGIEFHGSLVHSHGDGQQAAEPSHFVEGEAAADFPAT